MNYEIHYSYTDPDGEQNSDALGYSDTSVKRLEKTIEDIFAGKVGAYSDHFRKHASLYIMDEDGNLR